MKTSAILCALSLLALSTTVSEAGTGGTRIEDFGVSTGRYSGGGNGTSGGSGSVIKYHSSATGTYGSGGGGTSGVYGGGEGFHIVYGDGTTCNGGGGFIYNDRVGVSITGGGGCPFSAP